MPATSPTRWTFRWHFWSLCKILRILYPRDNDLSGNLNSMVNHYIQFGKVPCNSVVNQSSMWPPTRRRSGRAAWDWTQGWKKRFFASFPQHISFSAGWFFHCQPWPDRLWKIQDGTGEVWDSEVGWKQWIDYIRGKKSQWMTRKEEKCPSTTTEKHVRPAAKHSFPVFGDEPIINSCSFFSHLSPFFYL